MMHVSLTQHLLLIFFQRIMDMIIKAIPSMTPDIIPATSPVCGPCCPHSESVESVPGFISFSPTDSHLKGEGPDHRFGFMVYIRIEDWVLDSWSKGSGFDPQCPQPSCRPSGRFLS